MTRKKFVPLFTESGAGHRMVAILPGRHPCQCLAVRHRLIGNCTSCGRIVCEQEGSGNCYFCGNLVLSAEERKLVELDTNAARKNIARIRSTPWAPGTPTPPWTITKKLRRRYGNRFKGKIAGIDDGDAEEDSEGYALNSGEEDEHEDYEVKGNVSPPDIDAQARLEEGLVKALVQRDRLLHFDATTAKRTRVIDDEVDYFVSEGGGGGSAALWLDPETRARVARRVEELRAQRRALRSQAATALTIDFSKMTVSEERRSTVLPTEEDLSLLNRSGTEVSEAVGISDPLLNVPVPQNNSAFTDKRVQSGKEKKGHQQQQSRVQDPDQQKVEDRGFCLSMHQPWASLLVRGVKIHEGRSWYSAHRGPLWIAAAAKVPDEEEVRAVETEYLRHRQGAKQADLPTSYPTGVLLGRVTVEDVLPQKEYRLKYPDGESESPYVFVCSDPRELLIKLPMSDRLEPHILAAAKENLT